MFYDAFHQLNFVFSVCVLLIYYFFYYFCVLILLKGEIKIIKQKKDIEPEEELVSDIMQLMNVFVSRMNGLRKYKKNKEKAMLELIQFLVRSSGCKAAHLLNSKEILKSIPL